MPLPVNTIYIDARFKNKRSNSSSVFKFQLANAVQLLGHAMRFVEHIIRPHGWYSIGDYNNIL